MFHLTAPLALFLLPLVPLLVWRHRTRRGPAVVHPDLRLFDPLPARPAWLARNGGFTLRLLGLTALIAALSGPRWPDLRTRLDTEGVAVLMALDVSGSMNERDFDLAGENVSRLEAVQRVFRPFLAGGTLGDVPFEGRPADLVGLLRFAARPEVVCPLTLQHGTLLTLLDAQTADADPGTNLPDAVALSLARLHAAGPRRKVLILLTDGEDNEPKTRSGWSPRQTAVLAKSLGVKIHTIDAGPDRGGSPDANRLLAQQTLQELAEITQGEYLPAGDAAGLARACSRIDALERSAIPSFQYRRYHEGYPWLGLAAFALFALGELLDRTLWRRVP